MTLPRGVRQPLVAKVLNARWGRGQNPWAAEQTNVIELVEAEDGIGKVIHSVANPVLSGLVDEVLHRPGASSLPQCRF